MDGLGDWEVGLVELRVGGVGLSSLGCSFGPVSGPGADGCL